MLPPYPEETFIIINHISPIIRGLTFVVTLTSFMESPSNDLALCGVKTFCVPTTQGPLTVISQSSVVGDIIAVSLTASTNSAN